MGMNTRNAAEVELPALTRKQSAFVHGLLRAKSASDAYRAVYDCSSMADRSIWCEASKLRANPKVAQWLRYFQRMGLDAARMTVEAHLTELARDRELAIAHGQISAAVQAEHYRGKAAGFYENRLRLTTGPSDVELIKAIRNLLGDEVAEAISTGLGVANASVALNS